MLGLAAEPRSEKSATSMDPEQAKCTHCMRGGGEGQTCAKDTVVATLLRTAWYNARAPLPSIIALRVSLRAHLDLCALRPHLYHLLRQSTKKGELSAPLSQ